MLRYAPACDQDQSSNTTTMMGEATDPPTPSLAAAAAARKTKQYFLQAEPPIIEMLVGGLVRETIETCRVSTLAHLHPSLPRARFRFSPPLPSLAPGSECTIATHRSRD